MKGTFFIKPLEFNIDIQGESFEQGNTITGAVKMKSHQGTVEGADQFGVTLALVDQKKIKNKKEDAFTIVDKVSFPKEGASEEMNLDFSFKLSSTCPVTTKGSSLYLLCGQLDQPLEAGALELSIAPHPWIKEIIETLTLFFRFKVKGFKSKKDSVEYKIVAPDSKEFGAIKQLTLLAKMEGENIALNYQFNVSKLSYGAEGVQAKDQTLKYNQELSPKDYKQFGDSPNQEGIKNKLSEILDQVKRGTLI